MTGRETVALGLLLPPPDHLPPAAGDGAGVVLQQHPAQHVHRRQLAQPARGGAVIDRFQQRVPVPGAGDRQLLPPGLRLRRPPGGHRRAVAAGPAGRADPLLQPVRVRRCQRLHRGPHGLPGQLQPVQRRHRRHHVRGVGALLAARLDQAIGGQLRQQRVQRHLLQPRLRHLAPELRQHRLDQSPGHPGAAPAGTASRSGSAPPRPPAGQSGPPPAAAPSPAPAATGTSPAGPAGRTRPRTPHPPATGPAGHGPGPPAAAAAGPGTSPRSADPAPARQQDART